MSDRADNVRLASTPWRGQPIKRPNARPSNAKAQRAALAKMSPLERLCGLTNEQYDAFHAAQRASVRARLGIE